VPRERADARTLAEAYRDRWRLENVFQTLTEAQGLRTRIGNLRR
jgi:IS4 transposase